jgi:hypothetical protein
MTISKSVHCMAGNAHFTTAAAFTFADTGSLLAVESQTTVVGATHCTNTRNTVLAVDEKAEKRRGHEDIQRRNKLRKPFPLITQ